MNKVFNTRLDNTSKMLLHFVQDVRRAAKRGECLAAVRSARDAMNMASLVITYGSALETLNQVNRKEQK